MVQVQGQYVAKSRFLYLFLNILLLEVVEVIQTAIRAPTGSPSDGLGGDASESSTSTAGFVAAQKQIRFG